ncbi:MAG: phosphate transport system [Methylocystaceae bacterium]|nr:MAG: phosphate transport system [Methylocystaceae bacterium]
MTVGSAKRTVSERLDDMTEHTVKSYEQELHELTQLTARMGALTQQQFRDAINALINSDENLANHVSSADDAVDELQQRIEQQAIHLIAKR